MSTENLDKFKNLVSNKKSGWNDKAMWRKENKAWLKKKKKIAARILTEIGLQKETNNMSQKKLADAMNVSPQYINKIVKGEENLTLETITKIESVLGINLIEIPLSETSYKLILFEQKSVLGVSKSAAKPIGEKLKLSYSTDNLITNYETGTYG